MIELDTLDLEETDCLICGSSAYSWEASGRDFLYDTCGNTFNVVECSDCGHLYVRPRPKWASARVIYPENYSTYTRLHSKHTLVGRLKSQVMKRRMKPLGEALKPGCAVLDVGCGDGQLLLDLKESWPGLQLVGNDLHFSSDVEQVLGDKGIQTIEGLVEECDLGRDRFDLVIMNQLIEHLWDPALVMAKIFRAIKPGGLLSVETVNSSSYDRKWFRRRCWGGYYWPRHLQIFSDKGLTRFLEQIGFRVQAHIDLVAPLHWTYTFHALVKSNRWLPNSLARFFSDVNPMCLAMFTCVDISAKLLGKTTTNQKIIARKPPESTSKVDGSNLEADDSEAITDNTSHVDQR